MRIIKASQITYAVKKLCIEAAYYIDEKILNILDIFMTKEPSFLAKNIIKQIIDNDILAKEEHIPMCQDTGITLVFLEIGRNIFIDGNIEESVNEGVRKAYDEAFLRKSVVDNPIERNNTKNNTPAIIYEKIVEGDKLKISVCLKGAGSENMSKIKMLNPSDGIDGIKEFVLSSVKEAGGRACPPLILGIGIGGTMDKAALLSKEALLRESDDEAENPVINNLEKELLELINNSNVGPMGLGGKTTALAVKINYFACHIASLPIALTIQCHSHRHKAVIL